MQGGRLIFTTLLLLFLMLFISGCGKKGALIYPDMLVPSAASSLNAKQFGSNIKLSFMLPQKDLAGRTLKDLAGVRILKREAFAGTSPTCSSCTTDFNIFKQIYLDSLNDTQRYGNLMILLDGNVIVGNEYSYKVVPFNKDTIYGAETPVVLTKMIEPPLPPILKHYPEPTEIGFEFVSAIPVSESIEGYNLYKAEKGNHLPLIPINREPIKTVGYIDTMLDRNSIYIYSARSVIKLASGELIESRASNEVESGFKEYE